LLDSLLQETSNVIYTEPFIDVNVKYLEIIPFSCDCEYASVVVSKT